MGSWGNGVLDNDHARDLLGIVEQQLIDAYIKALAQPALAWDDLEGPLAYVHLLGLIARESSLAGLDRATVESWRGRTLEAFDAYRGSTAKRLVVEETFETLLSWLPEASSGPQKSAPATKAAKKALVAKKSTPKK